MVRVLPPNTILVYGQMYLWKTNLGAQTMIKQYYILSFVAYDDETVV